MESETYWTQKPKGSSRYIKTVSAANHPGLTIAKLTYKEINVWNHNIGTPHQIAYEQPTNILLRAGGTRIDASISKKCDAIDFTTGKWFDLPNLNKIKIHSQCAWLPNKREFWSVGGTETGNWPSLNKIEILKAGHKKWVIAKHKLNNARSNHGLCKLLMSFYFFVLFFLFVLETILYVCVISFCLGIRHNFFLCVCVCL